jgi:succinyl-CoA synthetase beta subunit
MNLHEHQAKELLDNLGVPVSKGTVAFTPEQAVEAAHNLLENGTTLLILKAQIHAGGRGKGVMHDVESGEEIEYADKPLRGVKVMPTDSIENPLHEIWEISSRMLGNRLVTLQTGSEGKVVNRILVADGVDIEKEFYCSILLDRAAGRNIIMVSTEGGVEIEKVAEESPDKIVKEEVDPGVGLEAFQARRLGFGLGLSGKAFKSFLKFIDALYKAYIELDASLVEINPLVLTPEEDIIAVDSKVSIDDNALYRHSDIADMRDESEEDPLEVEASRHSLNYIKLDGNVGCMVNGAGLAMATMDIIKLAGGDPANFLDVGGGASVDRVAAAFEVMMSDPNVRAVLINIFGGIVRCDRVANGIIQAMQTVEVKVPVIVRLQGTNAEEARDILESSDLDFAVAMTLQQAADKVTEALEGQPSESETVMNCAMAAEEIVHPLNDEDDDLDDDDEDDEEDDFDDDLEDLDDIEDIDFDDDDFDLDDDFDEDADEEDDEEDEV